jgi:hypothetical protein
MVQTKFPKSYRALLRAAWKDGAAAFFDGGPIEENPAFGRWLSKALRRAARNHTYKRAFNEMADQLDVFQGRGVVDRLGDLARDEERSAKIEDQTMTTRQRALAERAPDEDKADQEEDFLLGLIEATLEDYLS